MTVNELTTPLGLPKDQAPPRRRRLPVALVLTVGAVAALAGFAGWVALVDDPLGGEPVAIVAITPPPPVQPAAAPAQPAPPGARIVDVPAVGAQTPQSPSPSA